MPGNQQSSDIDDPPVMVEHILPVLPARYFKVVYVFSGKERHSDVRYWLTNFASSHNIKFDIQEIHTERGEQFNVLEGDLWESLMSQLDSGNIHFWIITPPCNTHSRARHASQVLFPGPKPLRNRQHPYGFPWLDGTNRSKVDKANTLVQFTVESCLRAARSGAFYLAEHPEDLGTTASGEQPASIWQLSEMHSLLQLCQYWIVLLQDGLISAQMASTWDLYLKTVPMENMINV